jgi:hypothetical protein
MTNIVAINGKNNEHVAGSGHSNVLSASFGFLWNFQFNLHLLTEMMADKNVHCRTKPNFVLHHSPPGLGALAKSHAKSMKLVGKLRLASGLMGFKERVYRLIPRWLPLGIKMCGGYIEFLLSTAYVRICRPLSVGWFVDVRVTQI